MPPNTYTRTPTPNPNTNPKPTLARTLTLTPIALTLTPAQAHQLCREDFEACLQSFPNKYAHTSSGSLYPYIPILNPKTLHVTRYEHIKRIAEERVAELKKITVRGSGLES